MKKTVLFFCLAISLSQMSFVRRAAPEKFIIDTKRSSVEWKATELTGSHNGTLKIASGFLTMDGANLVDGSFDINMTTLVISDIKGMSNQNLLNHLKSDDFFSVVKNPTSNFQIQKVSSAGADRINITGKLVIKGISNTITFPATIKKQGALVVAVAKGIKVDRTKYDIKYRSKTFFGDVGDRAIDDEFEVSVSLVAKK